MVEKFKANKHFILNFLSREFIYILLAGLFIRIGLSFFGTYQLDHNTFIAWGRKLAEIGFINFYSSGWSDYLPGYLYVLRLLAETESLLEIPTVVLYKLPAIFGDIITSLFIYLAVKKNHKEKTALLASSVFLFNPAVFANSTLWGQVDVFSSLFTIGPLLFFNNIYLSSILLAIGGSIKPQAAMVIPVILALMIKKKWSVRSMVIYFSTLLVTFITIFLPFSNQKNLILFILDRISVTMGQYPYGSVNAFNFWGLWGFWKPDDIGLINSKLLGNIIVASASFFSFLVILFKKEKKYIALAFLFLVNFLFLTRMHERHLLPVFAPLAIAAASASYLWTFYVALSATYLANLFYAYQFIEKNKTFYIPESGVTVLIWINLLVFALFFVYFFFNKSVDYKGLFSKYLKSSKNKFGKDLVSRSSAKKYILLIVCFAVFTRIINLGHPDRYYFDEIYHQFTAREMLKGDARPWHWSSDHPEGFAYEWTHPPLGKEIMAASMAVLGENHFAARLPGAMMGAGIVYLTYLLAFQFTKRYDISLMSSIFMATDGLLFTMSRIATVDIYFVFFSIFTLHLLIKQKYFLSALFLGFATASKWSTVWLIPILFMTFISMRLKIKKSLVFFLSIPPIVYLVSYAPMFRFGYDLVTFKGMQQQMWWYHSKLEATHRYASNWWSWPFNLRPVYLYQLDDKNGLLGNIYAMGNPFFFWFGVLAVVAIFYLLIRKRLPKIVGLVLFSYLAFFVPWSASPRIMFIYHYLPALPFLAILSAILLRKFPKLIIPMILLLTITFFYFYPHWSGIAVPEWFSKQYYWLKSWR